MAVILRRKGRHKWEVLCAATHGADVGDIYLDDAQSYALSQFYRHALLYPESEGAKAAARDIEEWSKEHG